MWGIRCYNDPDKPKGYWLAISAEDWEPWVSAFWTRKAAQAYIDENLFSAGYVPKRLMTNRKKVEATR